MRLMKLKKNNTLHEHNVDQKGWDACRSSIILNETGYGTKAIKWGSQIFTIAVQKKKIDPRLAHTI